MKSKLAGIIVLAACVLWTARSEAELLIDQDCDGTGDNWESFGAAGFQSFFGDNPHARLLMDNSGNSSGVFQLGIPAESALEYTCSLTDVRIEHDAAADAQFGLEHFEADTATRFAAALSPRRW